MPPPHMPLGHEDFSEQKVNKTRQTKKKSLYLPLNCLKESVSFPMCGEIYIYKGNFVRKEAIPERAFSPERSVRMGGDLCLQTFPPFSFCEFSRPPPGTPKP